MFTEGLPLQKSIFGQASHIKSLGSELAQLKINRSGEQHLAKGDTEQHQRVEGGSAVPSSLNEMNSCEDEKSDRAKDASVHVLSTYYDNKHSGTDGSQGYDDERLNELRLRRKKERRRPSCVTKRPGLYQRQLRHKHTKPRTRLNNQMTEADTAFAKPQTEAVTQTELLISKLTANLEGRHSIVEGLTRFLDEAESQQESNWMRFMTEMECLNEAVTLEIKICRRDVVRGLLDKEVIQRSKVEQEEHMALWEDSCLYCIDDGCRGCSGD